MFKISKDICPFCKTIFNINLPKNILENSKSFPVAIEIEHDCGKYILLYIDKDYNLRGSEIIEHFIGNPNKIKQEIKTHFYTNIDKILDMNVSNKKGTIKTIFNNQKIIFLD